MMGRTHRVCGGLVALGGYIAFKKAGMLDPNINDITELITIYAASYYGSVAADNDHVWESSPLKDPFSWLLNKILHLTTPIRKKMEEMGKRKSITYSLLGVFDARHRSWQTHSELPLILIGMALYLMPRGFEWTMLMGFGLGYLSHALMDMLSVGGYNIVIFQIANKILKRQVLPPKIRLVPRNSFFATGGRFEEGVYRVLNFSTILVAIWVVIQECVNIYSN